MLEENASLDNSWNGAKSICLKKKNRKEKKSASPGSDLRGPTVLSGAEERGVDGPSLDRSYFARLQPISFLFFNPSSSHVC